MRLQCIRLEEGREGRRVGRDGGLLRVGFRLRPLPLRRATKSASQDAGNSASTSVPRAACHAAQGSKKGKRATSQRPYSTAKDASSDATRKVAGSTLAPAASVGVVVERLGPAAPTIPVVEPR